jgi:hypothetical protein
MKSNCKEVKTAVRNHIADYFTPEELKEQATHLMKTHRDCPTIYHAVRHMAEGGCFLIYNGDIVEFLNGLGINPKGKQYDVADSFKLYCHLIARDAELIVKKA